MHFPTQYQPIQAHIGLHFQKIEPRKELSEVVICFWELSNPQNIPNHFLIIPDGTIDLMVNSSVDPKLEVVLSRKEPATILIPPQSSIFGIRFYPSAFSSIFKVPVNEFSDNFELFEDVVPGKATFFLAEQLAETNEKCSKKEFFENFFISYLARNELIYDSRLLNALHLIYEKKGLCAIEKSLNEGVSPRQLRRLFAHYLGHSPKEFSKIIQIQSTIQGMHKPGFSFWDFGYYDQPHFIREMRKFTSFAPTHLQKLIHS